MLYWGIGKELSEKSKQQGWGAKVVEKLAKDIRDFFPDLSGFSSRNLEYMRIFAEAYPDENVATAVATIPYEIF